MVSTVLMALAINIKMSALLLVPGYLLTISFSRGIVPSILSFVGIIGLQVLIGIEFIMTNAKAYYQMAYNFDRVFMKQEQVNF